MPAKHLIKRRVQYLTLQELDRFIIDLPKGVVLVDIDRFGAAYVVVTEEYLSSRGKLKLPPNLNVRPN